MEGIFAAMPTCDAVKLLLAKFATSRQRRAETRKLMFIDTSTSHLYAPVAEGMKAHVKLPHE